jgi:pSer/pThr/pTyr-binding forkhead associated (FHA) protein
MDIFADLIHIIRSKTEVAFGESHPGPYLVRQRSEEEIRSGPSQAVGLTFMPGQMAPLDINNLSSFDELDAETDLLERFQVYAVTKSNRNIFANGITLGRAPNNDVVVPLASVSKFHAWLKREGAGYTAYDARSRFGTFVGSARAAPEGDKGIPISSGVQLKLGELALTFMDAASLHRWAYQQLKKK